MKIEEAAIELLRAESKQLANILIMETISDGVKGRIHEKIKTYGIAIQSLEKQIPKKATDIRYFGEAGYYIGLCPCCKSGNNSEFQYCWDCGQAIDWSGENVN